jgi:type II restriction/modification system DNA methylase subunit YeeA
MDTSALKNFAQAARRQLLAQVGARMEQVLTTDTAALREKQAIINQLKAEVKEKGKQAIIEEVAYTWFNRLCALRYMDVNHYTQVGIVSPTAGFTQPEILQQAKQGLIEPGWQLDRKRITGLLNRSISSPDGDQEAYRLLLVAACNSYNREMDFLFTAIEDVTELLMPEDLLSNQSVLQAVRDTLTPEVCQDVEVIGWLYQFYISEKKDQVMAAKGSVKKEDIPAVTQLFTPDWIVRYMVQNSLGRLWLLNHPNSSIRKQMDYYVQPADSETDFLKVSSPEDLKVLDPACGSGHILTYAFELLYAIYEEQGYDPVRIPQYILQKNLYGIEIDKRAAMLSSFALMMKARAKDKRFFSRGIKPNILEMEDVRFEPAEIKAYLDKLRRDLYTQDLWEGLQQFENAKTFGSLIRPAIKDVPTLRERMRETRIFDDLLLSNTNDKLLKVLEMSEYLSPRYQVAVANPPYFSKGMDAEFKQFAKENYPDSKADTLSMFIERNLDFAKKGGYVGMITLMSWMFLSSFEKLREKLLSDDTLLNMAHLGARAFDTISGEVVSTTMFVIKNICHEGFKGDFIRLVDGNSEAEKKGSLLEAINNRYPRIFFNATNKDFKNIPGSPIAYWFDEKLFHFFSRRMGSLLNCKTGLICGNNIKYIRTWQEIGFKDIQFSAKSLSDTMDSKYKWYPYNHGGNRIKWYGSHSEVVNLSKEALQISQEPNSLLRNKDFYFRSGITWNRVGNSENFISRIALNGFAFDDVSPTGFCDKEHVITLLAYMNSKVFSYFLSLFSISFKTEIGHIQKVPLFIDFDIIELQGARQCIEIQKNNWDSHETSWDFLQTPFVSSTCSLESTEISSLWLHLRERWRMTTNVIQNIEQENNRIFIEAYGLQDELTPEVPLEEITLTCNPHYRYKGNYTDEEREARLLEDTIKEFLSYAVGCMFGRYSLDKPGLILANQGETLQDYLRIIGTKPTFTPTETNVIPILDGDWFADDITARFKQFLKITFGEPNYEENLRFIEDALGKDLRKYFLKDFFKDHVQTYKKRPIYWLFSSPKGSFNALIYMHRYQPNTVSVVLNQYLREFREKLNAQRRYQDSLSISPSSSQREKTAALKELESLSKILAELKTYEDEVLFPLAGEQIEIDLDDGVVVNYAKFGEALRKI